MLGLLGWLPKLFRLLQVPSMQAGIRVRPSHLEMRVVVWGWEKV